MYYFESHLSKMEADEKGFPKKIKAGILTKAVDYGDVEAKMAERNEKLTEDWAVEKIVKKKINEVFNLNTVFSENSTFWYAKVNYRIFDERTGKEKITPYLFALLADDDYELTDVAEKLKSKLGTISDYEVVSVSKTQLTELIE